MVASYPVPQLDNGDLVDSVDWNLHVDDINDLNSRVGTIEGLNISSRLTTIENAYVPKTRSIATGTGLSGGGDLSANRTLSVLYGTTAGTAAQGNDSRITVTQDGTIGNSALGTRVSALEAPPAFALYTRPSGSQTLVNGTQKIQFPNAAVTHSQVTVASDSYTLQPGIWAIDVGVRVNLSGQSNLDFAVYIVKGTGTDDSTNGVFGAWGRDPLASATTVVRLTTATAITIVLWRGAAGGTIVPWGDGLTHVAFTKLG